MNLKFIKYFASFISVVAILFSIVAGGIWTYFALFYAFVLVPTLELFMRGNTGNFDKLEEEIIKKDVKYDLLVWIIVPIQYAMLIFCLYRISHDSLVWWEVLGIMSSMGIACGVFGINVAHELGHRSTKFEQFLSKMLLLTSQYMHFFVEHNRGHHKNVSTDDDPASSRLNETVYAFWFRSVKDGWFSAWHLENERMAKLHLPWYSLKSEMVQYQFIQLASLVVIFAVFGPKALLCYIGAAIMGFLLLETVNYIEHYGLRRKLIDGAYYEKVMPIHSWNSNHPIGRLLLFELTRHSDHHYMASRKYQVLRHFDQSPQMPTGYPGMMVLALIPPLWFKVMNTEVERYKATLEGVNLA
jgi:alkane 1-monooxygenase